MLCLDEIRCECVKVAALGSELALASYHNWYMSQRVLVYQDILGISRTYTGTSRTQGHDRMLLYTCRLQVTSQLKCRTTTDVSPTLTMCVYHMLNDITHITRSSRPSFVISAYCK